MSDFSDSLRRSYEPWENPFQRDQREKLQRVESLLRIAKILALNLPSFGAPAVRTQVGGATASHVGIFKRRIVSNNDEKYALGWKLGEISHVDEYSGASSRDSIDLLTPAGDLLAIAWSSGDVMHSIATLVSDSDFSDHDSRVRVGHLVERFERSVMALARNNRVDPDLFNNV